MSNIKKFTIEEAEELGGQLGVNWSNFNAGQFQVGLEVELEHGMVNPETNITNDNLIMTAKIVLAHLNEFPDYYERLEKMEKEADDFWSNKNKA